MLELREKNGPGAIAELIKPEIESSSSNVILVDGVRSNDEIQVLKKFGNVKLLAIHASTELDLIFYKKEEDQMILKHKNILKKETIVN